jgi:hypothetical protein
MLINGAERFVLAHEYGHVLMHKLHILGQDSATTPSADSPWDMEFAADSFGAMVAVESGRLLDFLPANMALEGAELTMKTDEIFDEVLGMASPGVPGGSEENANHPPFSQRVAVLEHLYRQLHPDQDTADDDLLGMQVPARTLDQIWRRARPQLTAILQSEIPLHPVWRESQ